MILQHWGATDDEIAGQVAGDAHVSDAGLIATRSITVDGPPASVFPWLVQMGLGRAGWYSYDWLDNLGRRSADRIHPEWQDVAPGDAIPGGPIHFEATIVDAPHAFVLSFGHPGVLRHSVDFTLAFELRPVPHGRTRIVSRVRSTIGGPFGRFIERWILGPGDGVMVRRQLLNLASRVEQASASAHTSGAKSSRR